MRIAVLADIHGNLPALEEVARDLGSLKAEAVWNLGDAVGYGAEPFACLQLLTDLGAAGVAGNHELAVAGRMETGTFNPVAAEAVAWTRSALGPEVCAQLGELPLSLRPTPSTYLFHGLPGNPGGYLRGAEEAAAVFERLLAVDPRLRLAFFGHTHRPAAFARLPGGKVAALPTGEDLLLASGRPCLVNPGSVGQPRGGDPRARYLLYDDESGRIRFRSVAYDVGRAQSLILAAGLPPALAARLSDGS